jgi:hypothetical protein
MQHHNGVNITYVTDNQSGAKKVADIRALRRAAAMACRRMADSLAGLLSIVRCTLFTDSREASGGFSSSLFSIG